MRAKKLLKKLSITLFVLGLVVLLAFIYLFYAPFEGRVAQLRDCVPRGVDFFVHKADLAGDFEGRSADFPFVPSIARMATSEQWQDMLDDPMFDEARRALRDLRKVFVDNRVDVKVDDINLFDEVLAREVQIAGSFGPRGIPDARWCAYARVSSWVKMGYGWLLQNGYSRDGLPGVQIADDGEFFKVRVQGQDYFCARVLDCLMLANDRKLLSESFELAQGNTLETEPLGPSAHYQEGVAKPLEEWAKRIRLARAPNRLEVHLRPGNLVSAYPDLRSFGKNLRDEDRNQKIIASFVNLDSWRFLSGSLVFEPRSLTLLTHLVVDANKHTDFQKELFSDAIEERKKWMDQFFRMVPVDACGAAALRMPADKFILEMANNVITSDERKVINEQLRSTGKYKNLEELVSKMALALQPRIGVILRPNRRSDESKRVFTVHFESPFPQWAWVFWVRKTRSGASMLEPLNDLINLFDRYRHAFGIVNAYKLNLADTGGHSDAAFEFAIPQIPGTGNVAVCTYGDYFIFGNSGPFIRRMIRALNGKDGSMAATEDYRRELEPEMSPAVNAVAFAWAQNLRLVAEDFKNALASAAGGAPAVWEVANRPRAEDLAFKQPKFSRYGSKARIPEGERGAWREAVNQQLDALWAVARRENLKTDREGLERFRRICEVFRTAYIQMEMRTSSLQISGRVLERDYGLDK